MTGESPPRRTCATAAPLAPVPEDIVSPTPRSKMRARMRSGASSVQNETLVRFGKGVVVLDQRAELAQVERLELVAVGDADRALRVADRDVLETVAGDLAVEAHVARPMSVRQARSPVIVVRISPGDGLDRERVRVGPAALAQVQQRLAGAVARQLGLGAVGVVDPQPGDVAGLVGRGEREHAVGADAEVAVAQPPHPRVG